MKRLFDLILILVISPLLIVIYPTIALAIFVTDGKPILLLCTNSELWTLIRMKGFMKNTIRN